MIALFQSSLKKISPFKDMNKLYGGWKMDWKLTKNLQLIELGISYIFLARKKMRNSLRMGAKKTPKKMKGTPRNRTNNVIYIDSSPISFINELHSNTQRSPRSPIPQLQRYKNHNNQHFVTSYTSCSCETLLSPL